MPAMMKSDTSAREDGGSSRVTGKWRGLRRKSEKLAGAMQELYALSRIENKTDLPRIDHQPRRGTSQRSWVGVRTCGSMAGKVRRLSGGRGRVKPGAGARFVSCGRVESDGLIDLSPTRMGPAEAAGPIE